jgi:hypothetical protein
MPDIESLEIQVDDSGRVLADWSTPESRSLLCDLCRACQGWTSDDPRTLTCANANPYCG